MRINNDEAIRMQEMLERRLLHGLSLEWDIALWHLEPMIRDRVQKPIFNLRDMETVVGLWSRSRREISLSRWFVLNHSWAEVRKVLHHEMAHQIADDAFGSEDETAHGPQFKKACQCLRIDSAATIHTVKGKDFGVGKTDAKEDHIQRRIQKLFALANSQNIHEADAAMLKAHALIAKYHLDLLHLESNRSYVSRLVSKPNLRHTREKYQLASLLQEFYFVQGIWVPVYVVEKGMMGRALEISGTPQDVDLAAYVYDFVIGYIDRQWRNYRCDSSRRRSRKIDFALGILAGFHSKLTSQKDRLILTESTYSLIAQTDPDLKAFMIHKYPRTNRMHHKPMMSDSQILKDGIEIGRKLVIYRGITQSEQSAKQLLLPG